MIMNIIQYIVPKRSKEYVTRQAIVTTIYYVESDIACMQKPMKDADKSGVSIQLH